MPVAGHQCQPEESLRSRDANAPASIPGRVAASEFRAVRRPRGDDWRRVERRNQQRSGEMKERSSDLKEMARGLSGRRLSRLEARSDAELNIQFENGARLLIRAAGGRLSIELADAAGGRTCPGGLWPTTRQREYLEFIAKYIGRFGRSPAESDIQRHFLVSAPSVNHMVQGLERRGFIERQPGVPRSIRVVVPSICVNCGGTHHLKTRGVHGSIARRV